MLKLYSSNKNVLLTGINGFIAFHITKTLLDSGYSVVGTLRSLSKADYLKKTFKDAAQDGRLDFAVVEDITKDGAFDEVLKSKEFHAVLHTSSPFHFKVESPEEELLKPAIQGTSGILHSIKKVAPSVKRVVIVSSFASIVNPSEGNRPGYVYSDNDWNPVTYEQGCENPSVGYYASKKLAETAAWDFIRDEKPSFSVTTICPPMVFGPPDQEITSMDKLNTSASNMYAIFTGKDQKPKNSVWLWVHVKDVAQAHVNAITSEAAANQRYLVTGGTYSVQQFLDFVWKHYPERAERLNIAKGNPNKLWPEGGNYTANTSKSQKDLNLKYRLLDEMCQETFQRFEELEKQFKN